MFENYNGFLKQTSESQEIFRYESYENDYIFIKGLLEGQYIKNILIENRNELITFLENLYNDENTNVHTKNVLKDIVKINKIKKEIN